MPLPPFILQGFDYINHSTTCEIDYYGVYNTLLGVSFPPSQGYTIHSQAVLTGLSRNQVDFPIYFRIDRDNIPLFFLEIKTEGTLASREARIEADSQMRLRISQLDEQSLSALSGVSALGRKLSFYTFHKANRSVSPTFIPRDDTHTHLNDAAPADRWGWDITTDEGFEKWETVTAQVKALGNHDSEAVIMDVIHSMADLQISPILQLPPEIISYIFDLTLLESSDSIFLPPPSKEYPLVNENRCATPFSLGAVCRDWRSIAWSTPVLWSSMAVYFNSKPSLNYNRSNLVKDWLSRSGQLPLSIRIFVRPIKLSVKIMMDLGYLAGIIKQYSSRWYHFELSAPFKIARYFRAEGSYAPILESLRLDIPNGRKKFDLVNCPRLKTVYLVSVRLSIINFSWDSVTYICAQALSFVDCIEILRNSPLLVHAEFIDISQEHRDDVPYPPGRITTPLRSLKVASACMLLNYITCPFLDELIYDTQRRNVPLEYDQIIIPFLGRSGPLRSFSMLEFGQQDEGPSILVELLTAMPSLTNLVLSHVDEILDVLCLIQSSQPRFLPYLETFDYTGPIDLPKCGPNPLCSLPPDSSLQLIKLNINPTFRIPKNNIAFFLILVERGVTVKIWSRSEDILQSSIDYYRDRGELLADN